jgi:hypothetical protein
MLGSNSYQRLECQQRYVTKVGDVGIIYCTFATFLMVSTVPDQGAGNCLAPGPNGAEKGMCRKEKSEHTPLEPVPRNSPPGNLY